MIQLRIKEESDLYNPYDPCKTKVNEGVYRYLKSYCSDTEVSEHTFDTLQIITENPIDMDRFQRVLQDAVKKDIAEFDRQIARNNKRVLWEIIIGVIFTALGIMLTVYLDKLLLTVISLFGSMAIRDAITIETTINHDIKCLKNQMDPIKNIKMEIVQQK